MTEYKIEKGVPISNPKRKYKKSKYPLNVLEVGDSFFVEFDFNGKKRASFLNSAVGYCKRRTGKKFTVRAVEGGLRVWRLK